MMIDTTLLYIVMFVYLTMILIQGPGDARRQNFCANYLPKLQMALDRIWHTIETYWSAESHSHSLDQYPRE